VSDPRSANPGTTDGPPPVDDLIGAVLSDRYKVIERIGEGGMGAVYLGQHVTLGKRFALKVLKAEMSYDKTIVERFLREAKATSSIEHENVVDILDFGHTPQGSAFFVMELLRGQELAQLMEAGPVPWARAKPILIQVAGALAAAHQNGIIHRDMKPGNVFLIDRAGRSDVVKVLDFGIAKVDDGATLTRAGVVFGTAGYMAPEQATGEDVDGRADMYALACLGFELLTGRLPFTATHPLKMLSCHISEPAPSMRSVAPDLHIPEAVDGVILRGLNKRPSDRFADMHEFAQALAAIPVAPEPARAPTPTQPSVAPEHCPPRSSLSTTTEPRAIVFPNGGGAPRPADAAGSGAGPSQRKRPPRPQPRWAPASAPVPAATPAHPHMGPHTGAPVGFPQELAPLAWLLVGLIETADGHPTNDDLDGATTRLHHWAPDIPLEQIAALVRHTIADYRALPDLATRAQRTREHNAELCKLLPRAKLAEVLTALYELASDDGLVRDQELRFIVTATQQLGLTPDPRLLAIAFLYLTISHADGRLDEAEKLVLREQAREWAPDISIAERAVVIRWAVAEFKRRPSMAAKLQCARDAADQLRASVSRDTRQRILADLWRLAGADGQISMEEQAFIGEIVQRFGAG